MILCTAYIVLPLLLLQCTQAAKLPASFKKCPRTSPKFDECLNDAIEHAVKALSSGVPKLGLLGLEPLTVTQFSLGRGKGPISLDLSFKNLEIRGITDVKITDQKTNLNTKDATLQTNTFNRQLVLDGDYQVDGKILLLPIRGKGRANIILDNVDGKVVITGTTFQKKDKTYLDINNFDYRFKPSRMRLQFDNLFGGEKQLSDAMNRILNDNWEEVLRELKPNFEEALSEVFKEYTQRLYQRVPLEEIYPLSEKM